MPIVLTIVTLLAVVGIWAPMGEWGRAGVTAMILVLWVLSLAHLIPA